jgi:hypothetical protein
VLIHFHLHDPIMIGKKKTNNVQFYVEVMEASYALDSTRRSGYDPDELEEEQRERALRNRMNQEFKNFVHKVEEQAKDLEFDIPYRELGFYGVPPHNKATCFIMPAVNALVELTEPPWFCTPLNDIEVAHFERCDRGRFSTAGALPWALPLWTRPGLLTRVTAGALSPAQGRLRAQELRPGAGAEGLHAEAGAGLGDQRGAPREPQDLARQLQH